MIALADLVWIIPCCALLFAVSWKTGGKSLVRLWLKVPPHLFL